MSNRSDINRTEKIEISVKYLLKMVIASWKAAVLFSFLITIVVLGAKYASDVQVYQATIDKQKQEDAFIDNPENHIKSILDAFDPDQAERIEFTANQRIWVNKEKKYLNDSLLMQMDLTNTPTLNLIYKLKVEGVGNPGDLILTYANYSKSNETIERIKPYIDPQSNDKINNQFIGELISVDDVRDSLDFDISEMSVLKIAIALPEGTDVKGLENAFTVALKDYEKRIGPQMGEHTIELIDSSRSNKMNIAGIWRRSQISNDIYTILVNTKNNKADLSPEEQTAIDKIVAIRSTEFDDNYSYRDNKKGASHIEITKPKLSKKNMLLGLILGFALYSFSLFLILVFRGRVYTAEEAIHISDAYLLGEIYYNEEPKGLYRLFHSKLMSRYLSRRTDKIEIAIRKTANTIASMSEHEEIDELTLLCLTDSNESIINSLLKSLQESGITIHCLTVNADTDETTYLEIDKAVCILGDNTKRSDLYDIIDHCQRYDIDLVGNVFIGKEL